MVTCIPLKPRSLPWKVRWALAGNPPNGSRSSRRTWAVTGSPVAAAMTCATRYVPTWLYAQTSPGSPSGTRSRILVSSSSRLSGALGAGSSPPRQFHTSSVCPTVMVMQCRTVVRRHASGIASTSAR